MNKKLDKQLQQNISKLPCFVAESNEIQIQSIQAGHSSQCFQVTANKKKYFVKHHTNIILFENERETTRLASKAELTAPIVFSDANWLVTGFIEGQTLDLTDISMNNKIEIALNLMHTCHSLTVNLPTLDLPQSIIDTITNTCFTPSEQKFIRNLLFTMPKIKIKHKVLCHGDFNFSNIINTKEKAWLIDFECASLAEKEFEIAMFFAINVLTEVEQKYALRYYQKLNGKQVLDKVNLNNYLLHAYLLNGLWYLTKHRENKKADANYHQLILEQFSLFDRMYVYETSLIQWGHVSLKS